MVGPLRVLVIGSGGREHALSLALSRDPAVVELHAAPGNPGTAALGRITRSTRSTAHAAARLAQPARSQSGRRRT